MDSIGNIKIAGISAIDCQASGNSRIEVYKDMWNGCLTKVLKVRVTEWVLKYIVRGEGFDRDSGVSNALLTHEPGV